jgi:hypothetical protein
MDTMQRYAVIREKNPREIVLLKGRGCQWRRCAFCDYYLDGSPDADADYRINHAVLSQVTGTAGRLEVINSGSFSDLDDRTMDEIVSVCDAKGIRELHFECHWINRGAVPGARRRFAAHGVTLKIKTGVESFDAAFREGVLHKGIGETDPAKIAEPFDECCLLFGITGQTKEGMIRDVETGLSCFERVCINIMNENGTPVRPDPEVIRVFRAEVLPLYRENRRVDILMNNTDFGVGAPSGKTNVSEGGSCDAQ